MNEFFTFNDLCIVPRPNNISSRRLVDVSTNLHNYKLNTPIILANMLHISPIMCSQIALMGGLGLLQHNSDFNTMKDKVLEAQSYSHEELCKNYARDMGVDTGIVLEELYNNYKPNMKNGKLEVGIGVGMNNHFDPFDNIEFIKRMIDLGVSIFKIDTANGYNKKFLEFLYRINELYPDITLMAGNVVTPEGVKRLHHNGADACVVGIGGGWSCSTRLETGVGVPQAYAIKNCSNLDIPIISDGGIKHGRDVSLALGLGADAVMIGTLYASCVESETSGTVTGSANCIATMYRTGKRDIFPFSEGAMNTINADTNTIAVTHRLIAGLRSAMSYSDSKSISEYQIKVNIQKHTQSGYIEGVKTIGD